MLDELNLGSRHLEAHLRMWGSMLAIIPKSRYPSRPSSIRRRFPGCATDTYRALQGLCQSRWERCGHVKSFAGISDARLVMDSGRCKNKGDQKEP